MRVVTVDSPGGENTFGESIFAGAADVIHNLLTAIFDDGFAYSCRQLIKDFIPTNSLPFAFTALPGALQRVKYSIGISNLIERRRTFGTVAATAARIFRIAFELLNLICVFVDIGEQPTGRLAVEASGRHQ